LVVFDQGFEEFFREELLKNLHSALTEALVMNREEAQQAALLSVARSGSHPSAISLS
jgi:hypothetical protein